MKLLRYFAWGVLALLILVPAGIAWKLHRERKQAEDEQAMKTWLDSAVLPKVEWRAQTLEEIISALNHAVQAAPNRPPGLEIVLAPEEETKGVFRRFWRMESPGLDRHARFTASLNDISAARVVLYTMSHCGVQTAEFRGRRIVLHHDRHPGTVEPAKSRKIYFPWKYAVKIFGNDLESPPPAGIQDVRSAFSMTGYYFFEGDIAEYEAATGKLRVRTGAQCMDAIEETVSAYGETNWSRRLRRFIDRYWTPARTSPRPAILYIGGIPGLDPYPEPPKVEPASK